MSSQKSRAEKMTEEFQASLDESLTEDEYQATIEINQRCVERENQDLWSLYRSLDASQNDVRELVNTIVEPSQSTVSRAIREKEDAVLTDKDAIQIGGTLHGGDLDIYPDEWLEAYRQVIADAHADLNALSKIIDEKETPEWAARRFPELVGSAAYKAKRLPGDVDIADESHLNRLDSVNTDRWK
jgi:hypothetical protein